jgi:hypothetical protein
MLVPARNSPDLRITEKGRFSDRKTNLQSLWLSSDVFPPIDGREVPIESITKAIREGFLNQRAKELVQKLTDQVVTAHSRK